MAFKFDFTGTELMVRVLIEKFCFIDTEIYDDFKCPPAVDKKRGGFFVNKQGQNFEHIPFYMKKPYIDGFEINVVLVGGENRDIAQQNIKRNTKKYPAFIELLKLPNIKTGQVREKTVIKLVDAGGHQTMWDVTTAGEWLMRGLTQLPCAANIRVDSGHEMATKWTRKRSDKLETKFFYISAAQANAKASDLESKVAAMSEVKRNETRGLLYKLWAQNLRDSALFNDGVHAGNLSAIGGE
jgi:hypothetical protein